MPMQVRVFRHSDSLVARDLAGEKVIIPVRGKVGDLGCIYTLNGVAGEIWNLLDGTRDIENIVEALSLQYDVDRSMLSTDVRRIVRELEDEGLIVATVGQGGQG